MKNFFYILFITILASVATSCWEEDLTMAGAGRHQVTDLAATPGDESVLLTWNIPEGWHPTDYIIFYTDSESQVVKIKTDGEKTYIIEGLTNDNQYKFNVQAVYNNLISNVVSVESKPSTSRFAVTNLTAEAGDKTIILTWSKPGLEVISYTLSYYFDDEPGNVMTTEIDKEFETLTLSDLVNDKNYYLSLVANYAKGSSEAATIRVMPTAAIPYALSQESVAKNQPVVFTFNQEGYPDATNITWTFPDKTVKGGTVVTGSFTSTGEQTVILSATIDSAVKTWKVILNVREYVVFSRSWETGSASYTGFKGTVPVFSPDGRTVYIVTFNSVSGLYAFDLITGNEKWRYIPETNSASYNMLTVNPVTEDIYYGTTTAGQFYAITNQGQLKWKFTEAGSMQGAAPAVNADGTVVYICDRAGNTFAIDASTGTKKWSYATGSISSGLLINGNDLIVGTQNDISFLKISDGSLINKITPAKGMVEITGFAVSNNKKTAYFSMKGGAMAALDLENRSIKATLSVAGNDCYEPVVAPNGSVFVGSKDGNVYNIDEDLTKINWQHRHPADQNNIYNYSHPCVDSNNRFYITSGQVQNTTYIFNSDGSVADSWEYEPSDTNQKQMGGNNYINGILFSAMVGGGSSNGIFVGKYVGGERASSWSTRGGDICGTSCIK